MTYKNSTVIVTTMGNSGGGAIHDYLLSRQDCVSPFLGEEFRLISDPYGLENLYLNLYENFSLNNSSEAFINFRKYCFYLKNLKSSKNSNRLIYGKKFSNLAIEYLKNIERLSYRGIPQFKSISLDYNKKLSFKLRKKLFGIKNHEHNFYKMTLPVEEKKFINNTKEFLINIFRSNIKNLKNKNIILDQSTNFWKPEVSFKYFDKLKIIMVSRDPRSVFYSMKFRQSYAYPGYDIKTFVIWYKEVMKKKKYIKKKYKNFILEIKFENFIQKFSSENKKIEKFLNLKKNIKNSFDFEFSRNNVFKAKKNLSNNELNFIKKELKNYLQW